MKLLANENFPKASVLLLREFGYDITSIGEDHPGISDQSVLEMAQNQQRLIITFDRDYGELIFKYDYKPDQGVLYLRLSEYSPEAPTKIVDDLRLSNGMTKNILVMFSVDKSQTVCEVQNFSFGGD